MMENPQTILPDHSTLNRATRRSLVTAVCSAVAIVAFPLGAPAFSILKGAGDIRRLKMHCAVTSESINTIYWIEGEYIQAALNEINHFMRDWRANQTYKMKARNLDVISATHGLLETDEPFHLKSGYRTPATNAKLRRRSRNVARNSLHMTGEAADISLNGRSTAAIADAAEQCKGGGVGRYRRSGFVHVDCGEIRCWSV